MAVSARRDSNQPGPQAGADVRGRAEFPPHGYWRRWCEDAPPAELPATGASSAPDTADALPSPILPAPGDPPYRVLIVEDDRSQALYAESVLNGTGMQARVVSVASETMEAMRDFRPDLVLMDLHMPGMSGTELTAQVREHAEFAHTPVVFLTGDTDPERQFEVLSSGADDYLSKPVRPRHLVAAVQNRIKRARALTAARDTAGAGADERHPVTGLHTRSQMLRLLSAAIPGERSGGVCFIEIEGTAALRERYGFEMLDTLLSEAGRKLGTLAGDRPAARLNDNTFLLYAPGVDGAGLMQLAQTLRGELGRHAFEVGGESLRLRAVVAYADLAHGFDNAGDALSAAEEALRAARALPAGIAAWEAPDGETNARHLDLADEIRQALAHDGFELAYQPIVAVAGGEDAQYQTLLRLRDAEQVMHTAAQIIPAAERAGVMHEIDRWVLRSAIRTLSARQQASSPVRLFVSQSTRSLIHDGHAQWLTDALAEHGVEGASLVIDVRLDDALIHALSLQEFCTAMVSAGVQLCLSQYQSGDEADALLAQLPLGYVRLSARYASQLDVAAVRDEMRAAIERAHRLGLQVIGQQVEDPQAAATLWMSGIDYIQGNLVQRAAEALDFDFQHSVL